MKSTLIITLAGLLLAPLRAAEVTVSANVRDFGAKGDGQTDDTQAIRKAVEMVAQRGGVVYFPPGHYLSATIAGGNHITFKGDSGWSYRAEDNGASVVSPVRNDQACLFDLKGSVGTRLVGLTLDGHGKGGEMHGVYASHLGKEQNLVIDDCMIKKFSGSGIRLEKTWVFAIRHSLIAYNQLSGIDGSASYDGWILDNQITGNKRGGLYATNFATVTITANRIEWNRLGGIVLEGSADSIQICNCTFDRNFGPGIEFNLTPWKGAGAAGAINGNIFRRNGYQCEKEPEASVHLYLRHVRGIAVTGNSFCGAPHPQDVRLKHPPSPLNGILLDGLVESVVANNSLYKAAIQKLIIDKGGHTDTVIRDNPGSLTGVTDTK